MPKIPLSIKTNYLPNWGLNEGVRELIQNGRDSEVEHNAKMTVSHVNGVLRIENAGTTLPHQALLLGHTTKAERGDTIGKFGEGLKLGVLALVRAGHTVIIRSGSEVWTPSLVFSKVFSAEVLSFDIQEGRQTKNRVRVEIGGISVRQWEEMRQGFLFLNTAQEKEDDIITTYAGSLLLNPRHKGKIFVKGIYVQDLPDIQYGYDFSDADLDRDRKMIETYNLKYKMQAVYNDALSRKSALFEQFNRSLQNPTIEVDNLQHNAYSVPENAVDYVHAQFLQEYGANAIPVTSLGEGTELEHLGVRPVVVNAPLKAVLVRKTGDMYAIRARLSKEVIREYSPFHLSPEETNNLDEALYILNEVVDFPREDLHIVDFRSANLRGQFSEGKVSLSREILKDQDITLQVLIHEVAHQHGTDGTKTHVQEIENLWTQVFRKVRVANRFTRTPVILRREGWALTHPSLELLMGADGGLSWMFLHDVKDDGRVCDLLRPLHFFTNIRRGESYEWLEKNPLGPLAIIVPYGTDLWGHPDFRDLKEVLDSIEEGGPEAKEGTTFSDMALEIATRPEWGTYSFSELELWVFRGCAYCLVDAYRPYGYGKRDEDRRFSEIIEGIPDLGELQDMKVIDWARELKQKLRWTEYHSVETWT